MVAPICDALQLVLLILYLRNKQFKDISQDQEKPVKPVDRNKARKECIEYAFTSI